MASDLEINDNRVEFIADYVIKSLKIKADKFGKLYGTDEGKATFNEFFEKPERPALVFLTTAAGALQAQFEWPSALKSKGCYFIKKNIREGVGKDTNLRVAFLYGDLSPSPIDQLAVFVEDVRYSF